MKFEVLFCLVLNLLILIVVTSKTVANECYFQESFETAATNAQAIFLGKAIEEKSIAMNTKGGNNIGYKDVKFEVEKSWKLINKQFVWIRVPAGRNDNCGYNEIGMKYLVYANQMNDILYISPYSRTMPIEIAVQDLKELGEEGLKILPGRFSNSTVQNCAIIIFIGLLLLSFLLLHVINKRPISQF